MIYEINNDNFAVSVFGDPNEPPFLYQPNYPNGETFDSFKEAEDWAILYVASMEDETAPYAPGGKGLAGVPKPTPEEIAAMQAEMNKLRNPSA